MLITINISMIILAIVGGGIDRCDGYRTWKICSESNEQEEFSIDVDAGAGREVFA